MIFNYLWWVDDNFLIIPNLYLVFASFRLINRAMWLSIGELNILLRFLQYLSRLSFLLHLKSAHAPTLAFSQHSAFSLGSCESEIISYIRSLESFIEMNEKKILEIDQ